jgi:hypothetical protein
MDDAQRRKAANEAVFREVNERIQDLQRGFAVTQNQPLHIVCECDRLDCTSRITVTVQTYESVRANADEFFTVEGHEDIKVEDIVDTGPGYLIVRKKPGEPREIAEETDPRS